jgi:hypothetical protein
MFYKRCYVALIIMEQKEIIKIIKTKDSWDSKDLIKLIKSQDKKQIKIKFCHIGGYECLKDGTKTDICKSLQDVKDILDAYEIEYDENITNPIKLVESIEEEWSDSWDDGGGSGWIEY